MRFAGALIGIVVAVGVAACGSGSTVTTTVTSPRTAAAPATTLGPARVSAASSDIQSDAVVRIGDASITKAALDHWLVVGNDSTQAATGAAAPPLPIPPNFTACVAAGQKTGGSASAAKTLCAQEYQSLLTGIENFLIQAIWIQGEAVERGVTVTAAQVEKSYQAQRKGSNPPLRTTAELNKFLAKSGQTVADLKWHTLINLLTNAISLKVWQQDETQSGKFTKKWTGRTECRIGYAVSSCSKALKPTATQPSWYSDTAHIVPPPSQAQTLTYSATSTSPCGTSAAGSRAPTAKECAEIAKVLPALLSPLIAKGLAVEISQIAISPADNSYAAVAVTSIDGGAFVFVHRGDARWRIVAGPGTTFACSTSTPLPPAVKADFDSGSCPHYRLFTPVLPSP